MDPEIKIIGIGAYLVKKKLEATTASNVPSPIGWKPKKKRKKKKVNINGLVIKWMEDNSVPFLGFWIFDTKIQDVRMTKTTTHGEWLMSNLDHPDVKKYFKITAKERSNLEGAPFVPYRSFTRFKGKPVARVSFYGTELTIQTDPFNDRMLKMIHKLITTKLGRYLKYTQAVTISDWKSPASEGYPLNDFLFANTVAQLRKK